MAARWRASEDAELARLYDHGVPLCVIAEHLNRSAEALTARRKLLGIPPRRAPVTWSAQQDQLIVLATRAGASAAAIARQQGRSVQQIRARRTHLLGGRPSARRYRPWEDEAIKTAWAQQTPDLDGLALRLRRTPDALRLRARALGLHAPSPRRRWSAAEDHALRDGYSAGLSCHQINRLELPHRSPEAIAARARKLGLTSYARTWSPQDDRRLPILLAQRTPLEQIAVALTRTPDAIRQRARKLDLPISARRRHTRNGRRWTHLEDEILEVHPGAHPSLLSKLLDRSDHSVRQRQRRLGLRTGSRSPHNAPTGGSGFAPAEDLLLRRELLTPEPPKATRLLAISARLARSPGELQHRRRELQRSLAAPDDAGGPRRDQLRCAS